MALSLSVDNWGFECFYLKNDSLIDYFGVIKDNYDVFKDTSCSVELFRDEFLKKMEFLYLLSFKNELSLFLLLLCGFDKPK